MSHPHKCPPSFFFVFVIVFVRHLAIETSSENLNSNLSSLYVPYCAVPSQDYSLALSFSFSLYFTFPLSVSFILSSFVHICLTKQKKLFLNQQKTFFHGIPSQKAHRSENENNCAYLLGINEQKVKCNRDSSTQDHENPDWNQFSVASQTSVPCCCLRKNRARGPCILFLSLFSRWVNN